MGPLAELLATGDREILDFFVTGLRDVAEAPVDSRALFYNASVLAHYAQTSTASEDGMPAPSTLAALFDQFVMPSELLDDGALMETAGAQCLLLAGFFEDQSRRRHNIRWYSQLGAGFFARAARSEASPAKALLLRSLSDEFEPWRRRHARLSRELRDQPYLLTFRTAG